jgi:predicted RNA-binding Zn-ribbon protein involved in translation (DUF1610 family)
MLVTKRGEKPHDYLRFKCPTCGTELIADAKSKECVVLDYTTYTSCPVCGYELRYDRYGQGKVSVEEYNKIKSQYEQKD